MAASGTKTVKVTEYDNLVFSWEETSQSIANNTTVVSWKMELVARGASGAISSNKLKPWKVTINGTNYSGTVTHGISGNSTKTLASGKTTIPHNVDGSKTFSYYFFMTFEGLVFAGKNITNKSGSGTGKLTNIPRQATITAAPNFTDEDNPTITYSNPAGAAVSTLQACISLDGSTADIAYRDIDKADSSYTFNLTDSERNVLRQAAANANSITVKFYIATTIGGTIYYNSLSKTMSVVNANPTINPTAVDVGTVSKGLTGDANNKVIKGYNTIEVAANAAALKGASIKSYKITSGSKSITTASGKLSNVESGSITYTVTDSRGNTTTQTLTKTLIDYVKPTCDLSVSTPTTDGNLTLTINGNYFNGSFGAVANALTVQYRLKENSGNYGAWNTATATISGNTYKSIVNLTGLNYRSSYTIEARTGDKIYNGSGEDYLVSPAITIKTMPVFDWGADDFNFNVPVHFSAGATGVGDSGEWVPTLNANAISSYSNLEGWYIKSGNVVTAGFYIKATCKSGYETSGISIGGLPYIPAVSAAGGGMCSGAYVSSGFTFQCWVAGTNGTITARVQQVNHTTATNLATSASGCFYRSNGGEITLSGTITYITA